jgi:hypothetical protein
LICDGNDDERLISVGIKEDRFSYFEVEAATLHILVNAELWFFNADTNQK